MTLPSFVPQLKAKLETVRERGEVFIGQDELVSWQRNPTATYSKFSPQVFGVIRRHWKILFNNTDVPPLFVQDVGASDTGVTLVSEAKKSVPEWFSIDDYAEATLVVLKKRRKYPL